MQQKRAEGAELQLPLRPASSGSPKRCGEAVKNAAVIYVTVECADIVLVELFVKKN